MQALEWIPFSEVLSANGRNCNRARNSDRIGCCIEACGPEAWELIEISFAFRSRHFRRCTMAEYPSLAHHLQGLSKTSILTTGVIKTTEKGNLAASKKIPSVF